MIQIFFWFRLSPGQEQRHGAELAEEQHGDLEQDEGRGGQLGEVVGVAEVGVVHRVAEQRQEQQVAHMVTPVAAPHGGIL